MNENFYSDFSKDYIKELDEARSLFDLKTVLMAWQHLAKDALDAIPKSKEEFKDFRRGLLLERRQQFAGQEWHDKYSNILMPDVLVAVVMVSKKYGVPQGAALIRMEEAGFIFKDGAGNYHLAKANTQATGT